MEDIEEKLLKLYGPILSGNELRKSLGYRSVTAFNTAVRTEVIGVNIFAIAGRKGKFALTTDVAKWLVKKSSEG